MTVYTNLTAAQTTLSGINTAIANCPSNQVVQLTNGTFNITDRLSMKTGVVLRGNNNPTNTTHTNTVLSFSGGDGFLHGLIEFPGTFAGDNSGTVKTWSAGLSQGSTTITLNNVTSLAVGNMVSIDQTDDAAIGVSGSETFLSRASGARSQAQVERITAISGSDVTLTHGVAMTNYVAGNTPQLNLNGAASALIVRSGVENLTVTNANAASGISDFNFMFYGSWDCWLKNVMSATAEHGHFKAYWAGRCEVRHCYFLKTFEHESQSYGANVSYYASYWLVEDNIFYDVTTPMFNWGAGHYNIFGYNVSFTNQNANSPTFILNVMGTHGKHQHMCLYEGNWIAHLQYDYIHGSSSHNTGFRNRFTGRDNSQKTSQTYTGIAERNNRYLSFVGNVMGEDGYHTAYRLQNVNSAAQEHKYIFKLGYAGTSLSLTAYDVEVTNTVVIIGNYNTVDDAIPAVESLGSDTLAASWYHSSKPSFALDRAWPAFDPVSPTLALGTKSYTNTAAGYRFEFGFDPPAGGGEPPPEEPKGVKTSGPVSFGGKFSAQ